MSYQFLLDENVPRSIYKLLKQKGFHVEYVPQGVDDRTVIRIARSKNLILITRDSDFADELRYPPNTHLRNNRASNPPLIARAYGRTLNLRIRKN